MQVEKDTGGKPNSDVEKGIQHLSDLSQVCRQIYNLYLVLVAYGAVATWNVDDLVIAKNGDVTLPSLGSSIPLNVYFILFPTLITGVYVYLQTYSIRLARLKALSERVVEVKSTAYPWIVNLAEDPESGVIGSIQRLIVAAVLWLSLPLVIALFAFKSLGIHSIYISTILCASPLILYLIEHFLWWRLVSARNDKIANDFSFLSHFMGLHWNSYDTVFVRIRKMFLPSVVALLAVFLLSHVPLIASGKAHYITHRSHCLELQGAVLSEKPSIDDPFVWWANYDRRDWSGADLSGAYLKRVTMRDSKLRNATLFRTVCDSSAFVGCDFRGARMESVSFIGALLDGANFSCAHLSNVDLSKTSTKNAIFDSIVADSCDFTSVDFSRTDLASMHLKYVVFSGITFLEANAKVLELVSSALDSGNLAHADFSGTGTILNMSLSRATFDSSNWNNCNLKNVTVASGSFRGANLRGVNGDSCDFGGAKFYSVSLDNSLFCRSNFNSAQFDSSSIRDSRFVGSNVTQANFVFCDLTGSNFSGCNLGHCNFTDAIARGTRFDSTYLGPAKFINTDLSGASFANADLRQADLTDAIGLTAGQLAIAKTLFEAVISEELREGVSKLNPSLLDPPNFGPESFQLARVNCVQ